MELSIFSDVHILRCSFVLHERGVILPEKVIQRLGYQIIEIDFALLAELHKAETLLEIGMQPGADGFFSRMLGRFL